jgi:integrase
MILVDYRHGLRASELVDLRRNRSTSKPQPLPSAGPKGTPSRHPIRGDELRALRRLAREQGPKSPFVFTSERGSPSTTAGFAQMVERAGEAAELGFKVTLTCSDMPADLLWLIRATIHGLCRPISAIEYPAHGQIYRAVGSKISGGVLEEGAEPGFLARSLAYGRV